ncbi:MAG: hypothetical protein ACYC8W_03445 [Candidatus Tyrphobacter sp.]
MGKLPRKADASTEREIAPGSAWEDSPTYITSGTDDAVAAAWYLTRSRIWPLICNPAVGPFLFGAVLFLVIAAIVVLGPAGQSHFIYTDF